MEKKTVKITQVKNGLRAEGFELFKGYIPLESGQLLAHDLYHHHFGEEQLTWLEVRALGARLHYEFDNSKERRLMPKVPLAAAEKLINREGLDLIPALPVAQNLPQDAIDHYTEVCSPDMVDLMLAIIASGYNGAIVYPLDAYQKVKSLDVEAMIKYKDASYEIELATGNVTVTRIEKQSNTQNYLTL